MANIKNIKVGSTTYPLIDDTAAHSLSDIAEAGDNITFGYAGVSNISSSDITGSKTISPRGLYTPDTSSYLGITSNSIASYPSTIFAEDYDFAWTVKFKCPSDPTQKSRIFTLGGSLNSFNIWCSLSETTSDAGKISAGVHTTGEWLSLEGTTTLTANTWYWVRVSREIINSTKLYKLEISTDGSTWNTEDSVTGSVLYNYSGNMYLSQVSSSYIALQYDLTGFSFTTNHSSVENWTAFVIGSEKAIIDALSGLTATVTELNCCDGVTSAIQTQLDAKADTTLSNVTAENVKTKAGTRIWTSDEYDLSTSANVVISHNLGLEDVSEATAKLYIKFTTATANYSVGDIISNFSIVFVYYAPSGVYGFSGLHGTLNLYEDTVVIPKAKYSTNGIFIYDKSTGALTQINNSVVKVFVKIIY